MSQWTDFKQVTGNVDTLLMLLLPSGELILRNAFLQSSSVLSCPHTLLSTVMMKTITSIFSVKNKKKGLLHKPHIHFFHTQWEKKKFWGTETNSYPSSWQTENEIVLVRSSKCMKSTRPVNFTPFSNSAKLIRLEMIWKGKVNCYCLWLKFLPKYLSPQSATRQ